MHAAAHRQLNSVRALLQRGADVNEKDGQETSLLASLEETSNIRGGRVGGMRRVRRLRACSSKPVQSASCQNSLYRPVSEFDRITRLTRIDDIGFFHSLVIRMREVGRPAELK